MQQEVVMNPKVQAFFDEFPFLKEVHTPGAFDTARVERVDETLLNKAWDSGYGFISRVSFFTKEGKFLARFSSDVRLRDLIFRSKRLPPPTFGGLLNILAAHEPFYIVQVEGNSLTLFKPPKNFTLKTWLEELYQRGQREVKTAIAHIDQQGEPVTPEFR